MENNKVKNKCIYLQNREGKRFRHKKKTLRISSEGLTKLAAGPQERPSIHLAAVLPNGSRQNYL